MKNFLVIGEKCMDIFQYGDVSRLSPEVPVPILTDIQTEMSWGMAANVHDNLRSLAKGDSEIKINYILSTHYARKHRYVHKKTNHYFLRVDIDDEYPRIDFKERVDWIMYIEEADFILISDYNKGFLTYDDIKFISDISKSQAFIFLDTKKLVTKDLLENIDYLKCNYSEYEKIPNDLFEAKKDKIIVTCGDGGARHNDLVYPTKAITTMDVSGAGDTFFASLVYKFSENAFMGDSIRFANEMSNIVVQKKGVSVI